jgi:long-chain acyl-CoA synthetase
MTVDAAALQAFVRERLAAFKVPVEVVVSETALPRNAGGKLVKSDLRKAFGA